MSAGVHKNGSGCGLARLAAIAACAAFLGGCGSINEKMSQTMAGMPAVGLPAGAPERPAEVRAYPAVHERPPPRTTAVLTGSEQGQMEKDLVAMRDRQKAAAEPPPAEPAPPAKPAQAAAPARKRPAPPPAAASTTNVVPASSSRMIY